MVNASHCQSKRDFPRFAIRSIILDGTQLCATERVGAIFILLCWIHTTKGMNILRNELQKNNIPQSEFKDTVKLILAFQSWVDQSNPI